MRGARVGELFHVSAHLLAQPPGPLHPDTLPHLRSPSLCFKCRPRVTPPACNSSRPPLPLVPHRTVYFRCPPLASSHLATPPFSTPLLSMQAAQSPATAAGLLRLFFRSLSLIILHCLFQPITPYHRPSPWLYPLPFCMQVRRSPPACSSSRPPPPLALRPPVQCPPLASSHLATPPFSTPLLSMQAAQSPASLRLQQQASSASPSAASCAAPAPSCAHYSFWARRRPRNVVSSPRPLPATGKAQGLQERGAAVTTMVGTGSSPADGAGAGAEAGAMQTDAKAAAAGASAGGEAAAAESVVQASTAGAAAAAAGPSGWAEAPSWRVQWAATQQGRCGTPTADVAAGGGQQVRPASSQAACS